MKTNKHFNIRSSDKFIKQVKRISKIMKISQRAVIEIAVMELEDLLKQYPRVDYRPDLNGFLLRRDSLDLKDYKDDKK
jgi:hypothetical protein